MSKNKKFAMKPFFLLSTVYCLLSTVLTGCATVPVREALPAFNINGTRYLPLVSLCDLRSVDWQYDTFTRTVILSKDANKINLMAGDTLVLVNGQTRYLKHPVDIYQGTVVVPYKFKEEIFDSLFKKMPSVPEAKLPLTRIKKVVIDAGHGGNDPGAIGKTGLREKDLTLDIAKRLGKLLSNEGVEVVFTRSSDRFIPLSKRVEIANNSGADLFLSIHGNANRVRGLSGFEVYYLSPYADDSSRALSAAKNAHLNLDNSCLASDSLDLKATLWDMVYTYNRAESLELSGSICRIIERNLNTRILGIKGANFYVLKGTNMPAVLIETGFLSNYNEERLLKNGYYRQQIAEAIVDGIKGYAKELTHSATPQIAGSLSVSTLRKSSGYSEGLTIMEAVRR